VPTHADRVAFHSRQIAQDEAAIRKSNAEILRDHMAKVDAVLKSAELLAYVDADGQSVVKTEKVALACGLSEAFVDKVLAEKWGGGEAPEVEAPDGFSRVDIEKEAERRFDRNLRDMRTHLAYLERQLVKAREDDHNVDYYEEHIAVQKDRIADVESDRAEWMQEQGA